MLILVSNGAAMAVALITGYDGFLGRALTRRLINSGWQVYGLSRHPSAQSEHLIPLLGDILAPNLGLAPLKSVDTIFHLAGTVNLGSDRDGVVRRTNVTGTQNSVNYARACNIEDFRFCSTAYQGGRNPYEESKAEAEEIVRTLGIPQTTIFKPSIIIGDGEHFKLEHFPMFALALIKLHRRADLIRRNIEGTLKLPPIEIRQRLRGNPGAKLNMVPVSDVVARWLR